MEHYDIDGLVQYGNQELPGTTEVVNPTWRTLDKAVRGNLYKLRKLHAALVGLLRPHLGKEADARALIRELFVSAADIEPDEQGKRLLIRIHRMATPAEDKAIAALLTELTELNFHHPETGLEMVYELT